MRHGRSIWLWSAALVSVFPVAVALILVYSWLPADGATGNLESFRSSGFDAQWLFERRQGGLRAGDLIVRAGGHTLAEWLAGAPRGPEWTSGGVVPYEVLRDGEIIDLQIRLAPISFRTIVARWAVQLLVSLACLAIGAFVFIKRPRELAARVLMLFCVLLTLQYWGDAYNFQFSTLPWRWPFYFQLAYEHATYSMCVGSVCYFALVFPLPHPLIKRFPRLLPAFLLFGPLVTIALGMALAPDPIWAMKSGSILSWAVALMQITTAILAGLRSIRTARDPVSRAQVRWILWWTMLGCGVLMPGYVLPLLLSGHSLLSHPFTMIFIGLIPFTFGLAVLRFRLFEIEVIINRTLVYGTLTVLLAGLYLLLVRLFTLLIPILLRRQDDMAVVFVATLGMVLAFAPLRRRVQAAIDRTFYRTKLDYQRLLPEMSDRLATSIVPNQLAAMLTHELPQRLQIASATLAVLDSDGEQFVRVGADVSPDHLALPATHPLIAHLCQTDQPILRLEPPSDLPAEALAFINLHGVELVIPLVVGAKQVGLYSLGPKLSGSAYNRDEVHLLRLVGRQAAVAVENSRLFRAEQEQRELTQALQEAADVVSSTLDLNEVLDRILVQVERVVAGDAFNIMLIEDGIASAVRWRGYEWLGVADLIDNLTMPVSEYQTFTQMARTGQPLVVHDTTRDPRWILRPGWEKLRSYVSAPIRVAGETIGFLNVDGSRPGQFRQADAQRLEAFAQHAAAALENARLYEQAQRELAERKRAEEQLKTSLAEKEVLLKEVHHRVKNNLQVISSLLHLQSKQIEDPETLSMFLESQYRVRSMALVHERLYQSEDLSGVDAAEYFRDLASYLHRSYGATAGQVSLKVDVDPVPLGIDAAIPCGLIISELVSNALKHAFPGGRQGQILVQLHLGQGSQCALVVSDDGIGLPEELDLETTESLGLHLVNRLVAQIEGSVDLDRSGGTTYRIAFPCTVGEGGE
ncbi:MAG: GAF domain-containing protein [Anaerolineae bacterium]|nr:GAF domain-containing protein [Anaerolineae bacterium]